MAKGKLFLLPNVLDEALDHEPFFPGSVARIVPTLSGLIAENEKSARKFLLRFISREALQSVTIRLLNEHSKREELHALLESVLEGQNWGLISDAGLPCIADPGAELVALAHRQQVTVDAIPGPSSLIMALQLSGFFAQQFSFHGYLPREPELLEKKIADLERAIGTRGVQVWIEAPYRSQKMLEALKAHLHPATRLCVAASLTTPRQRVISQSVSDWKKDPFSLEKEPAVFAIA